MNRFCRVVMAAVVLWPASVDADQQLDQMVQQMQNKTETPLTGTERTCAAGVDIRFETEPSESAPGPSVKFLLTNHSAHTVAVKFGFTLTSTDGQHYERGAFPGLGTGHLNAGTTYELNSGASIFPNSIDPNGTHPQIQTVKVAPIFVAPNIDVSPPNIPSSAYIDTWRDYPDVCH